MEEISTSTVDTVTEEEIAITVILGTIVYIGGFVGNLLSLAIFIRVEIRRVSTGLLFLFLTISNTIQLLTLVVEFIDVAYKVRLFPVALIRCRLVYWLQNVFRALSSFIACTISFDRMFRVVYPFRAKHFCTCRMAIRIVLIYFLVLTISLAFYLLPYMQESTDGVCTTGSNPTYHHFLTVVWPPVRTVLVGIVPVVVMVVANVFLWRRVRQSRRRLAPHYSSNSHHSNTTTDSMLIFITIANVLAFIVTQIPFHMYTTVVRYKESIGFLRTAMLLWSSIYFGIGFYIYCLTSPFFRSKFILTWQQCFSKAENRVRSRPNTISQRMAHGSIIHSKR